MYNHEQQVQGPSMTRLTSLLALCLLAACDGSVAERAANDEITLVAADDPAMERAFAKARATLDEFFELAASPPDGTEGYSIKVAISDDDQTEYFWVNEFEREGDTLSGVLNNEPQMVKIYRMGERFTFNLAQVVDWTYLEPAARRMHGNFTACALLAHEDPHEAEEFMKQYGLQCD
jgi:uncharacterized protein YegJ (DUF2314 family)